METMTASNQEAAKFRREAALTVGDEAPDFDAKDTKGESFRLSDYRGKKNVVLYFYPGDCTPVCTREACGFRDLYEELRGQDTEVIGVSSDTEASHRDFAARHHLPFPLVSDPEKRIVRLYGADGSIFGLLERTKRLTFVVDKKGRIARIFSAELRAGVHLSGVKEALAQLAPA